MTTETSTETAYLFDGTEIEVVERTAVGVIVRRKYYRGDGSEEYNVGEPEIVSKVFASAPTERQDKTLAQLQSNIDTLRLQNHELVEKKKLIETQLAKLKKYPSLDILEAALDGRLTHYLIVPEYAPIRIVKIKDEVTDGYERSLKLLSLMGKNGDNPQWRLNRYSDDSGSYEDVFPCESREQAVMKMKEIVDARMPEAMANAKTGGTYKLEHLVQSMTSCGLLVPSEATNVLMKAKIQNADGYVETKKRELAAAVAARMGLDAVDEKGLEND